jgi:hypothetical protein
LSFLGRIMTAYRDRMEAGVHDAKPKKGAEAKAQAAAEERAANATTSSKVAGLKK